MSCAMCRDPDGFSCFPMYGVGPHKHAPGPIIGSTVLDEKQEVDGFKPDPECPGLGTWWCPYCGAGNPGED